jgi:hypothetical protein
MRVADSFKRFLPLLFGYDVFISYRRRDASSYVNALAAALHEVGFVCFLHREETVGGVELAPALELPLGDRKIPDLTRQIATHPFIVGLAHADTAMAEYHEIEDSQIRPYYVLGNPGTSSKEQYLDFVRKVEQLAKEL